MNRRTKILAVIGTLDSGGCERHLLGVLPRLDKNTFDARVFTLTRRGALADEMERGGIRVKSRKRVSSPKSRSLVGRALGLWDSAVSLAGELREFQPDIVHFFLPGSYVVGAPVALFSGYRRLIMSRRSLANYQRKHRVAGFLERKLHPRMSLLLGNSQAVVEQLRGEYPSSGRVELLYNGIEIDDFSSPAERRILREKLGVDDLTVALGILANLIPYKGHADLLRSCARVGPQNSNWKLFVIGRDDGIGMELKTLAASLGVAQCVVFLGERSDARLLLGAMDIGVSASHEEGFSNAILEFMAAGVPVVATDVGGNAEAVVDGTTGFVVPATDHDRMAEVITLLLHDGELRERMGMAGNRLVREKFSLSACVAAYETVYKRIATVAAGGKSLCVV